jgi:hypothetical protein
VRRALLLVALLGVPALAARARADELDTAELDRLERDVYVGRVAEAAERVAPHAQEPRAGALARLVSAWRRWGGETPAPPRGGEADARASVSAALLDERLRRETRGLDGLPGDGPLARLPDPEGLHAEFLELQRSFYEAKPDADPAASEHAADLRAHAYRVAGLAMAGCLVLVAALSIWLGRRPRAGNPRGAGGPGATGTGRS